MGPLEITRLALEMGFTSAGLLDVKTLRFMPEVRGMCEQNRCRSYGASWSCPPGCGTLADCERKARQFGMGVLLQTTGQLEDDFDLDSMTATEQRHQETFRRFVERLRAVYPDLLPLGAGRCRLCERCTYPDNPCRHPDLAFSSMEGFGLLVSQVCEDNGLSYYYGEKTITFVSCVLLHPRTAATRCVETVIEAGGMDVSGAFTI